MDALNGTSMKNLDNTTHDDPTPDLAQTALRKRRRILGAAAGGMGVLLSVQARTALGTGVCKSPSAMISGNTSPRPGVSQACSGGRSPGFWKQPQKFQYWSGAGATPPTFNVPVEACASGLGNIGKSNIQTPGTLVSTVLPGANVSASTGIWEVLAFPTSFTAGQLMRHLISAWLNAGTFPDYPLTRNQILDMWNAVSIGGLYCPSNMSCGTNGMSADDVVAYIEGMYDINAELEQDICKKNP